MENLLAIYIGISLLVGVVVGVGEWAKDPAIDREKLGWMTLLVVLIWPIMGVVGFVRHLAQMGGEIIAAVGEVVVTFLSVVVDRFGRIES